MSENYETRYVVRIVCRNGHREQVLDKFGFADVLPDTDHLAHLPEDHPLREPGLGLMTDALRTPDRQRLIGHASFRWTCKTCKRPYQFTYEAVAEAVARHAEGRDARLDVATIR